MWFDEACFRLFFMLLRGLSCFSFFLSLHFSFFLIPSSVFPFFFFSFFSFFFKLPDSRLLISFVALTVPFCTLFLFFSGSSKRENGELYKIRKTVHDIPMSKTIAWLSVFDLFSLSTALCFCHRFLFYILFDNLLYLRCPFMSCALLIPFSFFPLRFLCFLLFFFLFIPHARQFSHSHIIYS